ncbi:MAG: hypothetical protein SFZ03_00365 [Candidatus Melainabacteria bacterium]|nr:hypothetical protein [Candidatus Melainabacteria bacterium]
MMCCPQCASHFFKTLDRRYQTFNTPVSTAQVLTIYEKRRCKRCKFKWFVQRCVNRHGPVGASVWVGYAQWMQAVPLSRSTRQLMEQQGCRLMASEYSHRVSRGADRAQNYLKGIARAQQQRLQPPTQTWQE